jgi:hypothetical protein
MLAGFGIPKDNCRSFTPLCSVQDDNAFGKWEFGGFEVVGEWSASRKRELLQATGGSSTTGLAASRIERTHCDTMQPIIASRMIRPGELTIGPGTKVDAP